MGPSRFRLTPSAAAGTPRRTWSLRASTALACALLSAPAAAVAQDFSATIAPNPATLSAGGATVPVTVSTTPIGAFTLPITYSFSGFPAGVSTGGAQTVSAPYPDVTFTFSATAGVAPGTYTGTLTGDAGGRMTTFPMTVTVSQPDFTLTAAPPTLSLTPGQSASVMVGVTGSGGFTEAVNVTSTAPASVTLTPATFTVDEGGSQAVTFTASATALPGVATVTFSGTSPRVMGTRSATVAVTILPVGAAPVIQSITPPRLASGTRSNLLRIVGQNFEQGAVISSASPDVLVTGSRVLGPTLAEATVAVRPDARPGPYQLDLRNPDGAVASGNNAVLVLAAGSLAAPLAVTAVRVVSPRPWQILEPGQRLYPRAQLATTGAGTVVGTWLLDGIPFDRFTQVVRSGYPVEVQGRIPIPRSITGERRLELVIESPATVPSQVVPFLQANESRSSIRVLEPAPGASLDPAAPLFRWTLVPGASGYVVEVGGPDAPAAAEPFGGAGPDPFGAALVAGRQGILATRRVTSTWWEPEPGFLESLGADEMVFRVRAVYPGEVFDDPTPWRSLGPTGGGGGGAGLGASGVGLGGPSGAGPRLALVAAGDADAGRRTAPASAGWGMSGPVTDGWLAPVPLRTLLPVGDPGGEVSLAAQGTFTTTETSLENPPSLGRIMVSGQVDARGPVFDLQATGDVAWSKDLGDPWDGREESRNWLLRGGAESGTVRQEITLGYTPPSFFDQAEFLSVMSAGGAVQGTFGSPAGDVSYFRSLDLSSNPGFQAFEPTVDAAAYEYSDDAGRYLFRGMFVRANDPGLGDFSAGGEGDAYGVMGVVDIGPVLRVVGEAATGDYEPAEGSFDEARDGQAFRLTADGTSGTLGYGLTLGHTGEGFVNPANPGFTPGGVSDRTRAEARLSKSLGRAYLSGSYRHVRGGVAVAAEDPEASENSGTLSFSMPVSDRVSVSANGNLMQQSGDPVDALGIPATDRTQKGVDLSVSETLGAFTLTQSVNWQDYSDEAFPTSNQQVTGLNLFGSGAIGAYLTLSANVSNTRLEGAPELGTTDQFLVSLQPALTFADVGFDLSPRAAFTRIDNDDLATESKSDLYQIVARWNPVWSQGIIGLELAGDWSRSWTQLDAEPPPFVRQIVFTLSLNWQTSRSWPGAPR
jgi:hypothetical protein